MILSHHGAVWKLPALVGAGSLFALGAALALDGFWDVLSWGLLAVPPGLVARALLNSRRRTGHNHPRRLKNQ